MTTWRKDLFRVSARCVAPLGRGYLFLGLLSVFLSSCATAVPATISTRPFAEFAGAARQLDTASDQAFASGVSFTEAGFVSQVAADPKFPMTSLLVTQIDHQFETVGPEPTFMEIRRAQATLSSANKLLAEYASSLQELAAPELVGEAAFGQLAKDLNTNSQKVIADLSKTAQAPGAQQVAMFSAAAAEAARLYIEHKRQEDLVMVIRLNQPAIESFSQWCQAGVEHLKVDLYSSYSNQIDVLSKQLGALGRPSSRNLTARRGLIEQFVQLDSSFLDSESTLAALDDSYKAVPKAHEELTKAIQSPAAPLAEIQALYDESRRVQTLSKQLESDTAKSTPPASATKGK